ncbi:MAG: hypothetical protein EOO77_24930, partial [Oxalobacteraceae bacterium]
MTGRTIKSHDPDLDQSILDISVAVGRLTLAEEALIDAYRQELEDGDSSRVAYAVARKRAIESTITGHASRLHIPSIALRIIISQHDRLKAKMGRRPTMEQLVAAVEAAEAGFQERAQTDHAAFIAARHDAKRSRHYAEDSTAASKHLRA